MKPTQRDNDIMTYDDVTKILEKMIVELKIQALLDKEQEKEIQALLDEKGYSGEEMLMDEMHKDYVATSYAWAREAIISINLKLWRQWCNEEESIGAQFSRLTDVTDDIAKGRLTIQTDFYGRFVGKWVK